jgi:putative tryptophan/tyrosine transport system substrate-binding protein
MTRREFTPLITSGIGQFAVVQSVAPLLGVEVNAVDVRGAVEIERGVKAFARFPNGRLVVTASTQPSFHRGLIIALAVRQWHVRSPPTPVVVE